MDYCPRGSIEQFLRKVGWLSVKLSRHYIAQMLLALEHLHGLGVLYRDLKTANVLVDAEGHASLVDFGLSKESDHGGSFVGSAEVLAPEVLRKEGHDRRVDIYGLGALLYTFLAGKTPFKDAKEMQHQRTWEAILHSKLEMPAHATEDAASLITQLMDRDPEQRLGSKHTEDVRTHPFFSGVDFEALLMRKVAAPGAGPQMLSEEVTPGSLSSLSPREVFGPQGTRLTQCFASVAGADDSVWQNWEFNGRKDDSDSKFAERKEQLRALFSHALGQAKER